MARDRGTVVRSAVVALSLAVGCGSPSTPLAEAPAYEPPGQAKCGVVADHDEPLIIEWPAAERANLEALSKRGGVVVRYEGCEMQVLARCHVPRPYTYTPTTPQQEQLTIHDEDELYARLPLGAARLAGELARSGELTVEMTIVGTYATDRRPVPASALEGDCQDATHVVHGLTVGAFEFRTGAKARAGAAADLSVAGAGARTESRRSTLNRGGDPDACAEATGEDGRPPYGCGALLRVEVARIAPTEAASSPPAPPPSAEPAAGSDTAEPTASPEPAPPDEPAPPTEPDRAEPAAAPSRPPDVLEPQPSPASDPPTAETLPPAPPPDDEPDDGGLGWYVYVAGGVVVAALVTGAIIGAVRAGDEDEDRFVPQPGGLGEGTVAFDWQVVRW